MLLNEIAGFDNLEEAAEGMAGNHQDWPNFVWFGESKFAHPDHILLGYTVGPNSLVVDDANHRAIAKALGPYMGMTEDPTKTADNFGSSFHGDRNALKGFMVRVYDETGKITEAFKTLFELSRGFNDSTVLNKDFYKEENRKTLLGYVQGELHVIARRRRLAAYNDEIASTITDCLVDEDEEYDQMSEGLDEKIADILDDVLRDRRQAAITASGKVFRLVEDETGEPTEVETKGTGIPRQF